MTYNERPLEIRSSNRGEMAAPKGIKLSASAPALVQRVPWLPVNGHPLSLAAPRLPRLLMALALVVHHSIMVKYWMVLIGRRRASRVVRPTSLRAAWAG